MRVERTCRECGEHWGRVEPARLSVPHKPIPVPKCPECGNVNVEDRRFPYADILTMSKATGDLYSLSRKPEQ